MLDESCFIAICFCSKFISNFPPKGTIYSERFYIQSYEKEPQKEDLKGSKLKVTNTDLEKVLKFLTIKDFYFLI